MPVSRNSQSLTMAEVLKDYPSELEIGTTMESFQKALDSQRELFHSQIHQLRTIIVTQCHLTGVNPLSQEMAAGALSVKIGKRPRDLLNPKAVKYMQSLFSIKDAISKKESREIGALFGVTVTQVRDFFASQKSRVRKIVRLSRERAIRSNASEEAQDGVSTSSDLVLLDPVPLNTVGPSSVEDAPGCSNQDEILPSIGESDKDFVANIFDLMRKEETYAGQVKLMQWILQIENPSVLCWFMTKGGIIILATWLSQAAIEEQTSVIFVALKVLCHLPLSKALPAHMAIILQSVNRLRFYRMADLSNRARVLLSKWSKIFAKNQALNKPNGTKSYGGAQRERELRQRIDDLVGDDLWQSTADAPDNALCPSYGNLHDMRNTESPQAVKLLTSLDDLNKKQPLGISHNKARRKVQMVEQPRQKTASKNQQLKPVSVNQQRPITADEIQKAKIRAQFMQNEKIKAKRPLLTNDLLSASETYKRPKLEPEKKAWLALSKNTKQSERPSDDQKPRLIAKESIWEQCRKVQIPWHIPPVIWIDDSWSVGTGASSKEMAVQNTRMRREKETLYKTPQEIPANPKDPWDTEMDYDDTLTPDIPTEQPPDADDAPTELELPESGSDPGTSTTPSATIQLAANGAVTSPLSPTNGATPVVAAEPDIELLAVLLRNPELVFALTSGQGGVLSPEQTVKLLDMLRNSEAAGASKNGQLWKAVNSSTESKVEVSSLPSPMPPRVNLQVSLPSPTPASRLEVSLPSPTPPSSKPGPSVWAPEPARNLFSRTTTIDTTLMRGAATTVATIVAAPPARPQAAGGQLEHHQFLSSNPTGLANASAPQHYPHTTQPSSFTDHHHRNFHDTSLQQRISPPLHGNNVYNANLRSISIMPNTPRQLQPQPLPPLPHLVAEDTSISRVPKARQRYYASNSYNQSNQNAYNHPTMVGPSRAGLDWGPEDGPARYLEQVGHGGRGYGGGEPSSRSSLRGYGSVAPDRVRHLNSAGFREPNAQWSRDDWRWRDRERDRDWRR